MKNNIFLRCILIFIFGTVVVAENSYPNIGMGQSFQISFLFLLLLLNYKNSLSYTEVFLYGFTMDSLNSNFPFGLFTFLFLIYALLLKTLNLGSFREILFIVIYGVNYILTSLYLSSFSFISLFLNLVFYLVIRFLVIVILKK